MAIPTTASTHAIERGVPSESGGFVTPDFSAPAHRADDGPRPWSEQLTRHPDDDHAHTQPGRERRPGRVLQAPCNRRIPR